MKWNPTNIYNDLNFSDFQQVFANLFNWRKLEGSQIISWTFQDRTPQEIWITAIFPARSRLFSYAGTLHTVASSNPAEAALSLQKSSAFHPKRLPPFSIFFLFLSLLCLTSFLLAHEKRFKRRLGNQTSWIYLVYPATSLLTFFAPLPSPPPPPPPPPPRSNIVQTLKLQTSCGILTWPWHWSCLGRLFGFSPETRTLAPRRRACDMPPRCLTDRGTTWRKGRSGKKERKKETKHRRWVCGSSRFL